MALVHENDSTHPDDPMPVVPQAFGPHHHAPAPHKSGTGAHREGDEQRQVIDQGAVRRQAGAPGREVEWVTWSITGEVGRG